MKVLKEIPFNPKTRKIPGFEILPLEALFERHENNVLDHSLFEPQRIRFNLIIFITEGTGKHFIDFLYHPFQEGSILFISNKQVQAFDPQGTYKGFLVLFTNDFLLSDNELPLILPNYGFDMQWMDPVTLLAAEHRGKCLRLLLELMDAYHEEQDTHSQPIIVSLLNAFILRLKQATSSKRGLANDKHLPHFQSFLELLHKHYPQHRDAKFYATELHITYKYLNDICKHLTDISAKDFITNFVILEAKRLLIHPQNSPKEVAYEVGFTEPTNFAKFFKKNTGLTPSAFKNEREI